jgi:hypothetical protein
MRSGREDMEEMNEVRESEPNEMRMKIQRVLFEC